MGSTKMLDMTENHFEDDYKTLFFINIKKVPLHKSIWKCLLLNFQNMVKYVHFIQTYLSTYRIVRNHFLLNHHTFGHVL